MFFFTPILSLRDRMMVHGEDQVEITVHYVREDRNYEDWNLWLWEEGGQGAQVDFTGEDDYGKVATLFTTSAKTRFGFLVRKGNWAEKDIDTDRFFQIEAGGMDGVDACFGMHGMPSLSTGRWTSRQATAWQVATLFM